MDTTIEKRLLGDYEYDKLVCNYIGSNDNINDEDLTKVLDYALRVKAESIMIDMVLTKKMKVAVVDGEINFISMDAKTSNKIEKLYNAKHHKDYGI